MVFGLRHADGRVSLHHARSTDMGLSWSAPQELPGPPEPYPYLRYGYGLGVRWYSPVGPIRLDLAFPQQGEDDFRVHVSMGPDL